jgi:hypothetical protein
MAPAPPSAPRPGTFSHLSPPRRASWGAPGPACRRLRPGQDPSGSIYIFGGEGGGEDPRHTPPSPRIYIRPHGRPPLYLDPAAALWPCLPLPGHWPTPVVRTGRRGIAAARGAASPSRGSHQLVSLGCVENLGMSKTRPAPTGQFGCVENFEPRPRVYRRLASLPGRAVVVRLLPPRPSPSTGERRRPSVWAGWPAPTTPPPPRLGGPQPRAEATGTSEGGRQDASRRRAFRLARGITPGHPTPRSPATPGPPPQSTSQPGAAGPVASRLTIYSPTPFGWGNAQQASKCTESFPGALLNYVSGPCTGFCPYKVGHLFGPETPFRGLGGNSADFT